MIYGLMQVVSPKMPLEKLPKPSLAIGMDKKVQIS